jgi:hypothetical protein
MSSIGRPESQPLSLLLFLQEPVDVAGDLVSIFSLQLFDKLFVSNERFRDL